MQSNAINKIQSDETVTCVFINENKMQLIPYYDLMKMKKFSERRADYEKLKQISMKRYHAKVA